MTKEELAQSSAEIAFVMENALIKGTGKYETMSEGEAVLILTSAMFLLLHKLEIVKDDTKLTDLPSIILTALNRKKEELRASN